MRSAEKIKTLTNAQLTRVLKKVRDQEGTWKNEEGRRTFLEHLEEEKKRRGYRENARLRW